MLATLLHLSVLHILCYVSWHVFWHMLSFTFVRCLCALMHVMFWNMLVSEFGPLDAGCGCKPPANWDWVHAHIQRIAGRGRYIKCLRAGWLHTWPLPYCQRYQRSWALAISLATLPATCSIQKISTFSPPFPLLLPSCASLSTSCRLRE